MESPDTTKLPIQLAIAVLKDRSGRIELEVPVDGSLADPDFHLSDMIASAMGNVFNRIATSPFSALSSLFGGKGEALSFLEFEPGSTNLLPASLEKLDALANGLSERPELHLAIEGGADSKTDLEALLRGRLRNQDLPQTWKGKVTTNENQVIRTSLNSLADEKGGAALMRMATPSAEANSLDGEGGSWATFHKTSGELQTLAFERARNVKEYLLHTGKIQADRISVTKAARDNPVKGRHVNFRLQ